MHASGCLCDKTVVGKASDVERKEKSWTLKLSTNTTVDR